MINIKMQSTNDVPKLSPKIAVIGVGGAGGNAVNNMISSNLDGCEFIVCNTDAQALNSTLAEDKVQLGVSITGGLGAGSKPEVGQAAAEESLDEVLRFLDGVNMAFITCGMGGGTGTGAAPVIAKACRQQGILTVGVVTKPFHFEGTHRMRQAEKGIEEMQQYVDTLIVIPNQNLFRIANEKTTFAEAFKMADSVLQSGVRGVTDLMVRPGLVNLDFADIRTAMLQMGKAMMGTGEATGDKRAVEAAEAAINNPLLDDVSMKGANGVIINVTGGFDMTLFEADEACNRIRDEVDPSANIIFGATFDDSMDGFMRVSIVATGIEAEEGKGSTTGGGGGGPKGGQRIPSSPDRVAANTSRSMEQSAPMNAPMPSTAVASLGGGVNFHSAERPISTMSGREVVQGLNAPTPISEVTNPSPLRGFFGTKSPEVTPQESSMAEKSPTSIDMFEQSEFTNADTTGALRGSTYNDAFIPPKPMEPDMMIPKNGVGSHISSFHGAHVEAKAECGNTPTGLHLNPPKAVAPTSAKPNKERAPSLFERITGSVQNHIESFRDDSDMVKSSPSTSSYSAPSDGGLDKAVGSAPFQGSLDISTPAGRPAVKLDDELDIPAFLRRQAN